MNQSKRVLRAIQDRIIVRRADPEEVSKGGIIIPDGAKEKPLEGVVVAVGNGKTRPDGTFIPMNVFTGERVLFAKHAGSEAKVNDEKLVFLREEDVLAVFE